jgi:hypothetical protein
VPASERRLTEPWPVVTRCVSARTAAAAITYPVAKSRA